RRPAQRQHTALALIGCPVSSPFRCASTPRCGTGLLTVPPAATEGLLLPKRRPSVGPRGTVRRPCPNTPPIVRYNHPHSALIRPVLDLQPGNLLEVLEVSRDQRRPMGQRDADDQQVAPADLLEVLVLSGFSNSAATAASSGTIVREPRSCFS